MLLLAVHLLTNQFSLKRTKPISVPMNNKGDYWMYIVLRVGLWDNLS